MTATERAEKCAAGWPPVATKNLRVSRPPSTCLQEKSRLLAAPRRFVDGTCEKPATNRMSVPYPPVAAADPVPLLSRHAVHLLAGPYNPYRRDSGQGSGANVGRELGLRDDPTSRLVVSNHRVQEVVLTLRYRPRVPNLGEPTQTSAA
jgi:hypothetical protein